MFKKRNSKVNIETHTHAHMHTNKSQTIHRHLTWFSRFTPKSPNECNFDEQKKKNPHKFVCSAVRWKALNLNAINGKNSLIFQRIKELKKCNLVNWLSDGRCFRNFLSSSTAQLNRRIFSGLAAVQCYWPIQNHWFIDNHCWNIEWNRFVFWHI